MLLSMSPYLKFNTEKSGSVSIVLAIAGSISLNTFLDLNSINCLLLEIKSSGRQVKAIEGVNVENLEFTSKKEVPKPAP